MKKQIVNSGNIPKHATFHLRMPISSLPVLLFFVSETGQRKDGKLKMQFENLFHSLFGKKYGNLSRNLLQKEKQNKNHASDPMDKAANECDTQPTIVCVCECALSVLVFELIFIFFNIQL